MRALILGGVKSGKSRYAEQFAADLLASDVPSYESRILIATAQALDEEMHARISKHREARDADWTVIEAPLDLAAALSGLEGQKVVVIDCLTLWLTNLLMLDDEVKLEAAITEFLAALEATAHAVILVSNETNMGIMPLGDLTRRYCDRAGLLHQQLATRCNKVDLVVAGLPMSLKG